MTEKERLLQISAKQIFETGGNTIKADDVNFMFRYIESLENKIEKMEQKSISDDEHIGKMAKRLKAFEDNFKPLSTQNENLQKVVNRVKEQNDHLVKGLKQCTQDMEWGESMSVHIDKIKRIAVETLNNYARN